MIQENQVESKVYLCESCGCIVDNENDFIMYDGVNYCEDCFHANFTECGYCSQIIPIDDAVEVSGMSYSLVCEHCATRQFTECDRCGDRVRNYNGNSDSNDVFYCNNCREDYAICARCGEWVHNCDSQEHQGEYYCPDCYADIEDTVIREYHSNPPRRFHATPEERNKAIERSTHVRFYGIELEIDNHKTSNSVKTSANTCAVEMLECVNEDNHEEYFYACHDGSLTSDGIEIISQPMTREYYNKNMDAKVADMFQIARKHGYFGHDTDTCGLHFHISRNSLTPDTIDNMALTLEQFWPIVIKLSRRTLSSIERWANRYGIDVSLPPDKKLEYVKDAVRNAGRYICLNNTNSATVELRIFKSTLKYSTFLACWDFFIFLIEFAESHTPEDIMNMSEIDFIKAMSEKSEQLNDYLITRKLIQ